MKERNTEKKRKNQRNKSFNNHTNMTIDNKKPSSKNIISITDIIELKVKRELELQDYETQLNDLQKKKYWLEKEIQMATFIIAAVRKEITTHDLVKEITKDQSLLDIYYQEDRTE